MTFQIHSDTSTSSTPTSSAVWHGARRTDRSGRAGGTCKSCGIRWTRQSEDCAKWFSAGYVSWVRQLMGAAVRFKPERSFYHLSSVSYCGRLTVFLDPVNRLLECSYSWDTWSRIYTSCLPSLTFRRKRISIRNKYFINYYTYVPKWTHEHCMHFKPTSSFP